MQAGETNGKKKDCEFHQVHTAFRRCLAKPDRNFAGIESFHLYMGEGRRAEILCENYIPIIKTFESKKLPKQLSLIFNVNDV